jgi:hypothetical protein
MAPQENLSGQKFFAKYLAFAWAYLKYFSLFARQDFLGYFSHYEPQILALYQTVSFESLRFIMGKVPQKIQPR